MRKIKDDGYFGGKNVINLLDQEQQQQALKQRLASSDRSDEEQGTFKKILTGGNDANKLWITDDRDLQLDVKNMTNSKLVEQAKQRLQRNAKSDKLQEKERIRQVKLKRKRQRKAHDQDADDDDDYGDEEAHGVQLATPSERMSDQDDEQVEQQ